MIQDIAPSVFENHFVAYKAQAEDLLAGFYCEVDGDDKIKMDEGELKQAEWVSRTEIELQPSDYSLTNEMMKLFKSGGI